MKVFELVSFYLYINHRNATGIAHLTGEISHTAIISMQLSLNVYKKEEEEEEGDDVEKKNIHQKFVYLP